MDRIWAPWRIQYILGIKPEERAKGETACQCALCGIYNTDDDIRSLVVHRDKSAFIVMNLYPYNAGHIMIVPNRHIGNIEDMEDAESLEIMTLSRKMISVFKKVMNPEGFNLGFNLGRCAGAGIIEHIHLHIVPRWNGDANFMPVLGETKVINEHIEETFMKLRNAVIESKVF